MCEYRGEVDQALRHTEQDLQQVSQALRAYESVGMGFDLLVKEYTQLRDDVDNKRWAVRELKQHTLQDTS